MIQLHRNSSAANFHFINVKNRLISNMEYAIKHGATIKGVPYYLNQKQINFLRVIKSEKYLKKLVLADVSEFEEIISVFRRIDPNIDSTSAHFNRVLYNIFVNRLYEESTEFDKQKFILKIGIDTCPYCNRNYIYAITKKGKVKPEIDHFLPKSKYPYLGISFYNLIPSCQTCNGKAAKGNLDPISEGMLSPYEINTSDFDFSYKIVSVDAMSPLNGKSGVNIKLNYQPRVAGNNRVFKLVKLYKKHNDHALELIVKSKVMFGKNIRDYLNSFSGMSFSDSEINRLIIGNYTEIEDLHKRPLSKMYRDIAKKEGLI